MEIELISNIQLTFTISSFSCCQGFKQFESRQTKTQYEQLLPLGKRGN